MSRIRLLTKGPMELATSEAKAHGLVIDVDGVRANGEIIFSVYTSQYDGVLAWWKQSARLIRTLGPDD